MTTTRRWTVGTNDRPATMADVAARAGVSRALVSIVFRGVPGASTATRERVMRAADDLSYRPDRRASLLGSSRSRTIGVVFGLHHEFHTELVEHLYRSVEPTDFDLALGATAPTRREHTAVQSLLEFRCEALLLVGPAMRRADLDELAHRVPVVVVARELSSPVCDVVRTDDEHGARIAVEHLVALGHRRIAHVDGGRAPGAAQRRRGYREAMTTAGLSSSIRVLHGGLSDEDGERAAVELFSGPSHPTAVVAFNDHCAAGLLAAARQRGVAVPGDLSLVGYDDSHIAGLASIGLTTVAQDGQALADAALDLAVRRADGATRVPSAVVVPPHLVVRTSAAARSRRRDAR
ncbi:DNA-binding LacI/PurR family transcriptional regulator [Marmoricola sp. URHA0025 HA25]